MYIKLLSLILYFIHSSFKHLNIYIILNYNNIIVLKLLTMFRLCSFKKEVEGKGGVKSYRFGPDHRAFADPDHEPDNKCYCPSSSYHSSSNSSSSTTTMPTVSTTAQTTTSGQCAPHGTFNVSFCQYGEYIYNVCHCSLPLNVRINFSYSHINPPYLSQSIIICSVPRISFNLTSTSFLASIAS